LHAGWHDSRPHDIRHVMFESLQFASTNLTLFVSMVSYEAFESPCMVNVRSIIIIVIINIKNPKYVSSIVFYVPCQIFFFSLRKWLSQPGTLNPVSFTHLGVHHASTYESHGLHSTRTTMTTEDICMGGRSVLGAITSE